METVATDIGERLQGLQIGMAETADTDEALMILCEIGKLFGFTDTGVVLDVAGNRPLLDTTRQASLLGWPVETVERWSSNGFSRQYPAYMRCRFNKTPFVVDNARIWDKLAPQTRAQAQMRCDVASLGLRTMLTVPVHLPLGHTAAINWISRQVLDTDGIIERYGFHLLAIGHSFMVTRTPDYARSYGDLEYLTDRQIDCLSLLAGGKTIQETGIILDISEHTVRDHIRAITERLRATSTIHAVALAAQLGIIDRLRN